MTSICQKMIIRCPIRETNNNILCVKLQERTKSKYRGSIYALSMSIHYTNYTHKIPNVSPGILLGGACIRKGNWLSLQGASIRDFPAFCHHKLELICHRICVIFVG